MRCSVDWGNDLCFGGNGAEHLHLDRMAGVSHALQSEHIVDWRKIFRTAYNYGYCCSVFIFSKALKVVT